MLDFAQLLSIGATLGFGAAAVTGFLTARLATPFRVTLLFATAVSLANFLFRAWALYYRFSDAELPLEFATRAALILQVAIAVTFLLGIGVIRLAHKEGVFERWK